MRTSSASLLCTAVLAGFHDSYDELDDDFEYEYGAPAYAAGPAASVACLVNFSIGAARFCVQLLVSDFLDFLQLVSNARRTAWFLQRMRHDLFTSAPFSDEAFYFRARDEYGAGWEAGAGIGVERRMAAGELPGVASLAQVPSLSSGGSSVAAARGVNGSIAGASGPGFAARGQPIVDGGRIRARV